MRGYEIVAREILRTDGFTLHRARRDGGRTPVLLKVREDPGGGQVLDRELELLRSVSAAGVPRGLALHRTPPCLVLEDLGLAPVRAGTGERVDLERFLAVATALAGILDSLHERDLLCGIVNPGAVAADAGGARVQLLDFQYAVRPGDRLSAVAISDAAAAYMPPELSGRMNRRADVRSDLYSLGAALYELLTGRPPFVAADRLEMVHAHLARTPEPPADASLPNQVVRIVLRLLAKPPDERYQSAAALRQDLDRCAGEWRHDGRVSLFLPGRHDTPGPTLRPPRLHGREQELGALIRAFEDAGRGGCALLLVSGYAGVGKTSLVTELFKPVVGHRQGRFASGKFDQVVRTVPYAALIQAFRGAVWQMLSETDTCVAAWRERLSSAVGGSIGVLAEVIPEVHLLMGALPPPAPLEPAEAQNRFRYAMQAFVRAIARRESPLVVFLDDLQWADAATLDLLHVLLTAPAAVDHLLVVGAYRDNEIARGHVLATALDRLTRDGARLHHVPVGALRLPDLAALLEDTLPGAPAVEGLTGAVLEKTGGNPFFARQFLRTLLDRGLIRYGGDESGWLCDVRAVAAAGITDNVVDLMTRRIEALSGAAQRLLTLAACIGTPFRWRTLLTVSGEPEAAATAALEEARAAGLVQPSGEVAAKMAAGEPSFVFVHDRVQQAAYGLMDAASRERTHLQVGRLLLADHGVEVPDHAVFDVVNHLNLGSRLVEDASERFTFATLNLAAARKARLSTAWDAAAAYLDAALACAAGARIPEGSNLPFLLHLQAAECHYLCGRFDRAEQLFGSALAASQSVLERAEVYSLRIVLHENRSRYAEAVHNGLEGLALFGLDLPAEPAAAQAALDAELVRVQQLLAGRSIASLADLPAMNDPSVRMVMRLLTSMWAPAYLAGDALLTRLISATMVRLSLAHGNTEDSAYGYVTHAITTGPVLRDFAAAYEWGELALEVNERFGDLRRRAKIHQQFHAHVKLWRRPFESCIPHAREACRSGLQSGDFTYAGYGAVTETWPAFLAARDLETFVREYTPTLELIDRIAMPDFRAALQVMLNWAAALQGRTVSPLSLSGRNFDQESFVEQYRDSPFFLTFVYTARLHLALLAAEYPEAVEMARRARDVVVTGTIWPVLVDVWGSLAMAESYPDASVADRVVYRSWIERAREDLGEQAAACPENFRSWALLTAGALARVEGRPAEALRLTEEAVGAVGSGAAHAGALAGETAARLHLACGDPARAAALMREAYRQYAAWGALAKTRQLDGAWGDLMWPEAGRNAPNTPPVAHEVPGPVAASLDIETVLKVARAVAVGLDFDDLLRSLMTLALENAGADRAVLLLDREGTLTIEAEAGTRTPHVTVRQSIPWETAADLPPSVVRCVRRTNHPAVLAHAATDERFGGDPYIQRARVKSVLCVPIQYQGRMTGILYLENNLTTDAFTAARAEMMRILAAQAAVSLENARLYEGMKAEVERRGRAEGSLRDALSEVESLKARLEAENVYLQEEIRTHHNFNDIVGASPALLDVLRRVELVAPTDSTVLILGETGSGKELVARAVHSRSRRNGRPLVKVNCGAIAPGLVESELFGHVRGAFTGAIDRRVGRFELANSGTILLDEVGELPLDAQVKLLRVLQEQEFEPVGSSRTVRVNVRVIAATNRNLEEAVRQGVFRADLLYRLNVFPVEVPPLRDRRGDIPLLAGLFLSGLSRRLGKPLQGFSARSIERLMAYSWPGNVRELQNVVERAAILSRGPVVEIDRDFAGTGPREPRLGADHRTLDAIQRAHIVSVLKSTGGIVEGTQGAAVILGLHPNTLRSRMKKLGITARQES